MALYKVNIVQWFDPLDKSLSGGKSPLFIRLTLFKDAGCRQKIILIENTNKN